MGQCRPDAQHGVADDTVLLSVLLHSCGWYIVASRSSPPSSSFGWVGWVGGSRSPKTDVSAIESIESVRFVLFCIINFVLVFSNFLCSWLIYPMSVRVDLIKIVFGSCCYGYRIQIVFRRKKKRINITQCFNFT